MLKVSFILFAQINCATLQDLALDSSYEAPSTASLFSDGYLVLADCLNSDLVINLSKELSECAQRHSLVEHDMLRVNIMDGSTRSTFASGGNSNEILPCGHEAQILVDEYKKRTQEIGLLVAKFLDKSIANEFNDFSVSSLEKVVKNEDSATLDHFHVYSAPKKEAEDATLPVPFHVDMGLFLLLSPAVYIGMEGVTQSGLLLKKQDGSVFELEVPEPNSVIILLGAGIFNWMYSERLPNWRPAMHAVKPVMGLTTSRVVLARMFLPNMNDELGGVKFGDFFHQASSPSKWRRLLDDNCKAGEKYCWMNCLPEPACGDGVESVCANVNTGAICPDGDTCDCDLKCPDPLPTLAPSIIPNNNYVTDSDPSFTPVAGSANKLATSNTNSFCRGSTSMVMSGFESVGSANAHCIILFFKPWLLDTPWKFAFGCIGMILLGILVEAIIKARRLVTMSNKWTSKPLKDTVVILLFAINISLGYFCMLAAMTFNVEIFLSTVFGLAVGHLVLGNIHQPVRESADACCVTSESTAVRTTAQTSLRNSTGACCCNEA